MTDALIFISGMFGGAMIVLVMGALLAAGSRDDDFQRQLEVESHRKYVELLERELLGRIVDDSEDADEDGRE